MKSESAPVPSPQRPLDPEAGEPVEPQVRELEQAFAVLSSREDQIRTALVEAHDQLLRRDEYLRELNTELERLNSELTRLTSAQASLAAERDHLVSANDELWSAQNEAIEIIAARDVEIAELIGRLERVVHSRPVQLWLRFGRLPLVRSVFARRGARDPMGLGPGAG